MTNKERWDLTIPCFVPSHLAPPQIRRGRSRHDVKQFYIRFCFPDAATADAFRNRFGGECLTHAPGKPKPRTSATSSDAPAVKRKAEENWGKGKWR